VEAKQIADAGCVHCGGGTSRREFLTSSATAAAAALLVAACGGAGDATVATGPVSLTVQVSNYAALANVGGIAEIDSGGSPLAVVRTGADTFSAYSLICPHGGDHRLGVPVPLPWCAFQLVGNLGRWSAHQQSLFAGDELRFEHWRVDDRQRLI
jgi:hypothetical protein